ncbi:MAG: helix-turn-helix domain-containing protein [Alphaproteobacteria bacterium]|nr:helix-turn-helix domain-containing protein [Alphaproteobacteria bacterium]
MARKRRTNAAGRRETEQYLPIPYLMARSEAWRSLSGPAIKVFIEIRCRYNGQNNGELSLSLDEAARLLGIGKATAQRAFVDLEKKGFIKKIKQGQWYGRLATEWAVTDRPHKGHLATRDWKDWKK